MQSIHQLTTILREHEEVLGLIEYGSAQETDATILGDYDLFVILADNDPGVESLHFRVAGIPIDLNLRTLTQLQEMTSLEDIDAALVHGRIIHDPHSLLAGELQRIRKLPHKAACAFTEHKNAFVRHGHRHVFDKVHGRTETSPLLCRFLVNADIYWLVQSYFEVRKLPYEGEKRALNHLQDKEPELYDLIESFYGTSDLARQIELMRTMTQIVLAPAGGMWANEELLAFGHDDSKDLQRRGADIFRNLFGRQPHA
ncbi:hypothetical protein ACFL6M_02900 [Candidatus Eisenbacteria bacterium]|uniref:Polymerase nucleotidyl transferase domain-containing protein n=1 Tax=Eiseniibacteriota bacterium TaxID=2212470 RepID=A0ABV6YJM4_UNCEI